MALTEEQKQRIDEEEDYRAKIREEHKKPSRKGCSGCLIAILITIVFFAIILIAINPAKQFEQAEQHSLYSPTQNPYSNIGKHAYNKINGAYRGEILKIKPCNSAPELTCYVVNQPTFMRPIEAPVDNSVVKDEAPTASQ
jgi:hypothetical protein